MKLVINRLRRAFLAGLLVIVPVGVSIWVMLLLIGFLEKFQPVSLIGYKIPGLGIALALSTTLGKPSPVTAMLRQFSQSV